MRQFTTPEQTAKLIELGFEKPCSIASVEPIYGMGGISVAKAYTIGELIEILPENVAKRDEMPSTLNISLMNGEWCVQYADFLGTDFEFCNTELIDAICNMIVRLHEKGKI